MTRDKVSLPSGPEDSHPTTVQAGQAQYAEATNNIVWHSTGVVHDQS